MNKQQKEKLGQIMVQVIDLSTLASALSLVEDVDDEGSIPDKYKEDFDLIKTKLTELCESWQESISTDWKLVTEGCEHE